MSVEHIENCSSISYGLNSSKYIVTKVQIDFRVCIFAHTQQQWHERWLTKPILSITVEVRARNVTVQKIFICLTRKMFDQMLGFRMILSMLLVRTCLALYSVNDIAVPPK